MCRYKIKNIYKVQPTSVDIAVPTRLNLLNKLYKTESLDKWVDSNKLWHHNDIGKSHRDNITQKCRSTLARLKLANHTQQPTKVNISCSTLYLQRRSGIGNHDNKMEEYI